MVLKMLSLSKTRTQETSKDDDNVDELHRETKTLSSDLEKTSDEVVVVEDKDYDHDDLNRYKTVYNKDGDPIINSGHDVSRHLMSDRDDHDPALTLRGFILGTILAIFSNLLKALFSAKPTAVGLGTLFEMLILLVFGNIWAKFFPKPSWVKDRPKLQW
ncbi:unnamed protein product [Sympodiomycopsis kandeliae]